jgi:hypothetical protein
MEAWTFINKKTNKIIRYNIRPGDIEFGSEYYFTNFELCPIWFVENQEDIKIAYECQNHPLYNQFWITPSKDKIDIDEYAISKIEN